MGQNMNVNSSSRQIYPVGTVVLEDDLVGPLLGLGGIRSRAEYVHQDPSVGSNLLADPALHA